MAWGGGNLSELIVGAPFAGAGVHATEPDARELGQVFLWRGAALPAPGSNATTVTATWRADGTRPLGRFGSALASWTNHTSGALQLVVGAPRAADAVGEQAGAVERFDVDTS